MRRAGQARQPWRRMAGMARVTYEVGGIVWYGMVWYSKLWYGLSYRLHGSKVQ